MTDLSGRSASDGMEAEYRRAVSPELSEAIVRLIRDASRDAADDVKNKYAHDQANECRPWARRAELHTALLSLPDSFPEVVVSSERSSGSTYYVPIEVGAFILLVARAANPTVMLPPASYRNAIATHSAQEELFETQQPEAEALFYGVILYGGPSEQPVPKFIVVRFPTRDHAKYLDACIDLKSVHAALFDSVTPIEEIPDGTRKLALRSHQDAGSSDNQ